MNKKKTLNYLLASSLTLSTFLFPTHSKELPFTDQEDIRYQQAVSIISTVGLMVGDNEGNFNPTASVTRAEMAVICTTLLYGSDFPVANFSHFQLFDDVPDWATGYVNAAAAEGIVVGTGEKTFSPDTPVTPGEAMLMFLKTLGYFQTSQEFGSDWQASTFAKAQFLGLYQPQQDQFLDQFTPLTRDQVAQMAFYALTAVPVVDYNQSTGAYYPAGGFMFQQAK